MVKQTAVHLWAPLHQDLGDLASGVDSDIRTKCMMLAKSPSGSGNPCEKSAGGRSTWHIQLWCAEVPDHHLHAQDPALHLTAGGAVPGPSRSKMRKRPLLLSSGPKPEPLLMLRSTSLSPFPLAS